MSDNGVRNISKGSLYKLSLYINIILFFIVALFVYLLVIDAIEYGYSNKAGDAWLLITRDIAFLAVSLTFIFFQFFRNLFIIMRRTL